MKTKTIFKCSECGLEHAKWQGQCNSCRAWNTLEELAIAAKKSSSISHSNNKYELVKPKKLNEVQTNKNDRIITTIGEFNRVMGGGIVRDSITIITAKPGAGKSTLLLQVAEDVSLKGHRVLYASGEESESQIRSRADRILKKSMDNIWVVSDTSMDNVIASINEIDPDVIIVDSIQTFTLEAQLPSRAGSPTQTMECANELTRIAKSNIRPRAVILVGQMNKNEEIAGLRALEHLVDTVLIIDGENGEELRGITASKNRFGSTGETSFFSMSEDGMEPIENPSEYFMTQREANNSFSGSSLTVVREGTRPIIVEIESLVATTFTPYPSRISENLKREQLNTLISILEQRGGIELFNKNVVVKTTGGLQLKEQSANLSIIMSIVSSAKDKVIPSDTLFIADIGLTGELKRVPSLEARLKEADRMGFKIAYVAKKSINKKYELKNLKVIELNSLNDVIKHVFE
ncbi:DNA repair protein RadA [Lysinibacillus fusiformis]|uniref:DNA repair protein RadA n=1 Tax=Lysinibacillus fusiformis TaxID=28031 RepID=UPI002D78FAA8|nr:DNA repair protein RadA [Lysinibacillus fusiformis]WRS98595.1 DNA repair protein RadA [Lysinibacillus fusiformis]